jgi:hypothetical protein
MYAIRNVEGNWGYDATGFVKHMSVLQRWILTASCCVAC